MGKGFPITPVQVEATLARGCDLYLSFFTVLIIHHLLSDKVS
jgi:hypothetical protein